MKIFHDIAGLRLALEQSAKPIVLVPTMGNLHAGHIALMRQAKHYGKTVVATIFVNRLQFAANEDFAGYPRTMQADAKQLTDAEVDFLFCPNEQELYPEPQTVMVQPGPLQEQLEGSKRPGHFVGVATVVLKLFNIVQPQVALFGKKDYQQWQVLRHMTEQLNLPIQIVGCPTVRAQDGLALSSRNGYLSAAQRSQAAELYQQLCAVRAQLLGGEKNWQMLECQAMQQLVAKGWSQDYIAVREQATLQEPGAGLDKPLLVLGAAKLGTTRLIDNLEV